MGEIIEFLIYVVCIVMLLIACILLCDGFWQWRTKRKAKRDERIRRPGS